MKLSKIESFSKEIDSLITEGKTRLARARLMEAKRLKIMSKDPKVRLHFAQLAHRIHSPEISLSLLNPIVRPENKAIVTASTEEKMIYAAALIAIGATTEGL